MQNERRVLVSALMKAEKSGYSNILLNSVLNESNLDPVKNSFVTTVFYGVLERKIFIDFVLDKYLKKPIKKASPFIAAVLRSGAYQILFMEKVPKFAAVDEAVKITKKSKENANSGLINAVLRKLCNENLEILFSCAEPSVRFSVLSWMYKRLVADYGIEKTENFLEDSLLPPPIFVKINTLKANADEILKGFKTKGILLTKTEIENSFRAEGIKSIENLKEYKDGLFYVQDFSSTVCATALLAQKGMRVLDACAAPGGKTFTTAILMENEGEIVAGDIHDHRVKLILDGAKRLGLNIVSAKKMDATEFYEDLGQFDRVLCDVPCSGVGVIRRKPEIKYKFEQEVNELPDIQFKILENSAKYLKKGGRLIYSTCTLLKSENEEVVNRFLENNKDFVPAPIGVMGISDTNVTFIPPEFLGDGFFIAAFERK